MKPLLLEATPAASPEVWQNPSEMDGGGDGDVYLTGRPSLVWYSSNYFPDFKSHTSLLGNTHLENGGHMLVKKFKYSNPISNFKYSQKVKLSHTACNKNAQQVG